MCQEYCSVELGQQKGVCLYYMAEGAFTSRGAEIMKNVHKQNKLSRESLDSRTDYIVTVMETGQQTHGHELNK